MNKKELENSLITRGIILLLFLIGSILYACTVDKGKQETTQLPSTEEVIPEKSIIKRIQTLDAAKIITIDQKGHDVDITIYWTGVGCAINNTHYPQICEKCRVEQGLPPN